MAGTWLSYTRTYSRAVLLLFVPMYLGALAVTGWLRERILAGGREAGSATRALVAGGEGGDLRRETQLVCEPICGVIPARKRRRKVPGD